MKIKNSDKGYVVSIITFFSLVIMLSIALSLSSLTFYRQKVAANAVKSTQAYFAAEAGIEDALLRLKETPTISSLVYSLSVNGIIVDVDIPSTIGASKHITSIANNNNVIKNIQVVVGISDSGNATFFYGIQAGTLGFQVGNGSTVDGNVFSGGNISGAGTINYNAIVDGNCANLHIIRNLTFTKLGATNSCTVDGETITDTSQSATTLPIPDWQIDLWKIDAVETDDIIEGDVTLTSNTSLGPVKITGNLNIGNNTLTLTGTVYVQGDVTLGNNGGGIKLDPTIYENRGGVLIMDGTFDGGNRNNFSSAGEGSYLLILSTHVSPNLSDVAITVGNSMTGDGAAFYANNGVVSVPNGGDISEITGKGIITGNNITITTSSGVVNIYFASGPGASWEVESWGEY